MNCNEARERLSTGAENAAVAAHLDGCAACRARLAQLSAAVLTAREDEISCAECRSGMHAAVAQFGADADSLPPRMAQHLERCSDCSAELGLLGLSLLELGRPSRPMPPASPRVDTGFLRGPARAQRRLHPTVLAAMLLLALLLGALLRWQLGGAGGSTPAGIDGNREAGTSGSARPEGTSASASRSGTAAARKDQAALAASTERAAEAAAATPSPASLASGSGLDRATRSPAPTNPALQTPAMWPGPAPLPSQTPTSSAPPGHDEPPQVKEPKETDPPPAPTPSPTPPMETLCYVEGFGPTSGYLNATCGLFPALSAYDSFVFESTRDARWTFSLCARTELDSILALYPEPGFDPGRPCAGALAQNDDYCGLQSRITVDLPPGRYRLVMSETSGDLSDLYAIRVGISLAGQPQACPQPAAPIGPAATTTPSPAPASSPTSLPSATVWVVATETPTPTPFASASATASASPSPIPSPTAAGALDPAR